MLKLLRQTIASFALLTAVTGLVYPLAVSGIAQAIFPNQANGSLITKEGNPTTDEKSAIGSSLIGQQFTAPQYFRPRPSATSPMPYNAASSAGSNLGPTNPALLDAIKSRADALQAADPANTFPIPGDLVTTSASGLDPGESPAAALYQAARIAAVRKVPVEKITTLINTRTARPLLGEPTVNVLELNIALDHQFPLGAGAWSPASYRMKSK